MILELSDMDEIKSVVLPIKSLTPLPGAALCNAEARSLDFWVTAGAIAPSLESIHAAKKWAVELLDDGIAEPITVTCSVNGVITFEWDDGNRSLFLDVISFTRAEGYACQRGESHAVPFELIRPFPPYGGEGS